MKWLERLRFWCWRKLHPKDPCCRITDLRISGDAPEGFSVSVTTFAENDPSRTQTVIAVPGQRALQVWPKVKEM